MNQEKVITVEDVLKAIHGRVENEFGRNTIGLALYQNQADEQEEAKEIKTIHAHTSEVKVTRLGELTQIDLIYPSSHDTELNQLWRMFELYGDMLEEEIREMKEEEIKNQSCILLLQIIPKELEGSYVMDAYNPMFWCIMPITPNSTVYKIRAWFKSDEVEISEIETSYTTEETELLVADRNQESMEAKAARMKEERETYLKERLKIGRD